MAAAVALAAAAAPLAWNGGTGIGSAAAHADECGCSGGRHGGGGHGGGGSAMGGAGSSSTEQQPGGLHPGADQVPGGITDHEAELGDGGEEGHSGSGGHVGMGGRAGGSSGSAHAASAEERAAQHAKVEGAGHAGGRGRAAAGPGGGGIAGRGDGTDVWGPGASHGGADLPHVEIGRLNVAHAPSSVFDRAIGEALAGLSPQARELYTLPFEQALAGLSTLSEEARVEGPLQNLALYRALVEGRSLPLQLADRLDAAALFLGSAAGGEAPLVPDAVRAVNALLGVSPMDEATLETLAARAERVREALAASHEGHTDGEEGGHDGGTGGHVP